MPLFEKVTYHLSQSLPEHTRLEISRILDSNGSTGVSVDLATHILSDTVEFEGCDTLREGVVCVTPYWVERSMELGHLQDPKYFSADKDMFFSGVVATSADLPPGDKEVIASGILAQGGAWREGLTRDVTHLFVTNTRSEKYQTAMHFRDSAHITIVLPQWFDQCWSTQMRLPANVFQFPDPPYLKKDHDIAAYKAQISIKDATGGLPLMSGPDKQAMYGTMQGAEIPSLAALRARNIWQGRSILLSPLLELDAQRRESVEARIRRAGGVVVTAQEESESAVVEQADILITRFRTGAAYAKALAAGKTIGTLAWLFYVERTGVVSRPRDQLLHYPVRNKPIPGFSDHEITVTNYQGDAREYLKKLIEVMGAKFTPTMSGRNTIVIAAYKSGNKTAKAEEWSVPVVTHKWLEDCFVEWRNLTPAQKKYLDYAPGVNYGTILGDRGVGRVGLEEDPELLPEVKKPLHTEKRQKHQQLEEVEKPVGEGLNGTGTSTREALEVDEVEDVLHIAGESHKNLGDGQKNSPRSPTKFGPPRGVTKTPTKKTTRELSSAKPKLASGVAMETADAGVTPSNMTQGVPDGWLCSKLHTNVTTEPAPEISMTPTKVGSPVKSRPQSKPVMNAIQLDDDESVVEIQPTAKPTVTPSHQRNSPSGFLVTQPRAVPRPKTTSTKHYVATTSGSDQEAINELRVRKPKGKPRTQADTDDPSDGDVFAAQKPKSKLTVYKRNTRILTPVNVETNEEEGNPDGVDETPPRRKSIPDAKTNQAKTINKAKVKPRASMSESQSDGEIEILPLKKVGRPTGVVQKSKPKVAPPQPSPHRVVSVDLPDPLSLLTSRRHGKSPDSVSSDSDSALPLPRSPQKKSVRVSAHEASASSPKRGRPIVRRSTTPRSQSPSPRRSLRHPISNSSAAGKRTTTSNMSSTNRRIISRRTAAAAASQKLQDEIMPDLVNYENERKHDTKSGRRRRRSSPISVRDDEEGEMSDLEPKDRKRRKVETYDDGSGSGKGKGVSRASAEDSDVLPSRFVTTTRTTKRPADNKGTGQSGARKRSRKEKPGSEHRSEDEKTPNRSSIDPKKIRVLTTKVVVPEQVEKALTKLGMKFTQKPHECTHLVTNFLSRTEKFLCALPNVPFVLNMDWLIACADSGSVVAESDYTLQDPDMEHKHKFKLVDALDRARKLKKKKQKLLQGHFFYVTPSVQADFNVLKNVLHALGAECRQTIPTSRNISETRHVISSLKDKSFWSPLVNHGVTIYSHELVLGAAFTQFVDWDGEDKILARGD